MVFYSDKYALKAKHERAVAVEKARDLIKNPAKYNRCTSYGAAKDVLADIGKVLDIDFGKKCMPLGDIKKILCEVNK